MKLNSTNFRKQFCFPSSSLSPYLSASRSVILTVTVWHHFGTMMSCLHDWRNDSLIYHWYFWSPWVCLALYIRLSFIWLNHIYIYIRFLTETSFKVFLILFLLLLAYCNVFAGRWLFLFVLLSCNRKCFSLSNSVKVFSAVVQ